MFLDREIKSTKRGKERKMKACRVCFFAVCLLLVGRTVQANFVLNVSAGYGQPGSGGASPLGFDLAAGQWLCELVSPATDSRAAYWSWNLVNQGGHWQTYSMIKNGADVYMIGEWTPQNIGTSADAAFWHTIQNENDRVQFTLSENSHLQIGVCDAICWDNLGGVSVRFTQVPEPATMLLLGLGGILMRSKVKCKRQNVFGL